MRACMCVCVRGRIIYFKSKINLMCNILNVSYTSTSRSNLERTFKAATDHTSQHLPAIQSPGTKTPSKFSYQSFQINSSKGDKQLAYNDWQLKFSKVCIYILHIFNFYLFLVFYMVCKCMTQGLCSTENWGLQKCGEKSVPTHVTRKVL